MTFAPVWLRSGDDLSKQCMRNGLSVWKPNNDKMMAMARKVVLVTKLVIPEWFHQMKSMITISPDFKKIFCFWSPTTDGIQVEATEAAKRNDSCSPSVASFNSWDSILSIPASSKGFSLAFVSCEIVILRTAYAARKPRPRARKMYSPVSPAVQTRRTRPVRVVAKKGSN